MTTHYLKTWPYLFDAVESGEKNFEVRRDDRFFQKGDILVLEKFDPKTGYVCDFARGGQVCIRREVTWVLAGDQFGIEKGFVVLGLREIP